MSDKEPSHEAMVIAAKLANEFVKDSSKFETWGEMIDWSEFQVRVAEALDLFAAESIIKWQKEQGA